FGPMLNLIQKTFNDADLKMEQFATYIAEVIFKLPIDDFKKLIKDLKHNNNIDHSLFRVVLDIAEIINPIFLIGDYGYSIFGIIIE